MGRLLVIIILLLGGACPGEPPSSPVLNSSFTHPDTYTFSCTLSPPREAVTQLHWKEKHIDGTYSKIGVQNTQYGDYIYSHYKDWNVALSLQNGNTTFILEIRMEGKVVCCEIVTFPSGQTPETCVATGEPQMEKEEETFRFRPDLLGTLLVAAAFTVGSIVIICLIFRTRNRKGCSLREGSHGQRPNQRGHGPCGAAQTNLAYESTITSNVHDGILPQTQVLPQNPKPSRNSAPPPIPPPRTRFIHEQQSSAMQGPSENRALLIRDHRPLNNGLPYPRRQRPSNDYPKLPKNQRAFDDGLQLSRNQRTSKGFLPLPRHQRPSDCFPPPIKDSSLVPPNLKPSQDPYLTSRSSEDCSVPPSLWGSVPRMDSPVTLSQESLPDPNAIYSNVKRQPLKIPLKIQNKARPHNRPFSTECSPRRSLRLMARASWDLQRAISPYGTASRTDLWPTRSSSFSPEDVTPLWPHRSNPQSSPDSPQITINPMYHSVATWGQSQVEPQA
uniref:Ig-like domain-containing protein n=1 Tax=Xenopus tropicalis TaxID=8364 RepID=A0A1B8Y906_XENTR